MGISLYSIGLHPPPLALGLLTDTPAVLCKPLLSAFQAVDCLTLGEALHTGEFPIRLVNSPLVRNYLHVDGPGAVLLGHLPEALQDLFAPEDELFYTPHHCPVLRTPPNSRPLPRELDHGLAMYLRVGQCWMPLRLGTAPSLPPYTVLEIIAFVSRSTDVLCRCWTFTPTNGRSLLSTRSRFFCDEREAGVGIDTSRQLFPLSFLLRASCGQLVTFSADNVHFTPNGRRVHRTMLDMGRRVHVLHPLEDTPPSLNLTEIPALVNFREACRNLGDFILCTDGGWQHTPSPTEQFLGQPGPLQAGAAIVAIPTGTLRAVFNTRLPVLYIPDDLSLSGSVYPLEHLALVLALWTVESDTAELPSRCQGIHSDSQGAIAALGTIAPTSQYFPIDLVYRSVTRLCPIAHVHSHDHDKLGFRDIPLPALGNRLADLVASGAPPPTPFKSARYVVIMSNILDNSHVRRPTWITSDYTVSLQPLDERSRASRAPRYWSTRELSSQRKHKWSLGNTRMAAKAIGLGDCSLKERASYVRHVHDKTWRTSHHNADIPLCIHCSSSPSEGPPPQVGFSHWRRRCTCPKILEIKRQLQNKITAILRTASDNLDAALLKGFVAILRHDSLVFMGRLNDSSLLKLHDLLATRHLVALKRTLLKASRSLLLAFIDAGRSFQATASPEQENALLHARAAYSARMAEKKKKRKQQQDSKRLRQAVKAALTASAPPPPTRVRTMVHFYGNPSGGVNCHDGERTYPTRPP